MIASLEVSYTMEPWIILTGTQMMKSIRSMDKYHGMPKAQDFIQMQNKTSPKSLSTESLRRKPRTSLSAIMLSLVVTQSHSFPSSAGATTTSLQVTTLLEKKRRLSKLMKPTLLILPRKMQQSNFYEMTWSHVLTRMNSVHVLSEARSTMELGMSKSSCSTRLLMSIFG